MSDCRGFVLVVVIFSRNVFPYLPEQAGGGAPHRVAIVVNPESVDVASTLGLDISTDNLMTEPIYLLWESDRMYIIRLSDKQSGPVIQIAKDAVGGIVSDPVVDREDSNETATPQAEPADHPSPST